MRKRKEEYLRDEIPGIANRVRRVSNARLDRNGATARKKIVEDD